MLNTPQLDENPGQDLVLALSNKYELNSAKIPAQPHVPTQIPTQHPSRLASRLVTHLVSPPKASHEPVTDSDPNINTHTSNLGYLNYYNNYVIPSTSAYAVPIVYPPTTPRGLVSQVQSQLQVRQERQNGEGSSGIRNIHGVELPQGNSNLRNLQSGEIPQGSLQRLGNLHLSGPDSQTQTSQSLRNLHLQNEHLQNLQSQHLQSQLPLQTQLPPRVGGTYITYQTYSQPTYPSKTPKQDEFSVKKFATKNSAVDSQLKPYECMFPLCKWAFARQSDLRRHAKSHTEPMFHCPYWRNDQSCHRNGGAFNRLDVLKRHLRLVHYVKDKQQFIPEGSKEDPGWCRVCQRMFQNSRTFVDHCLDCAQQLEPSSRNSTNISSVSSNQTQTPTDKPSSSFENARKYQSEYQEIAQSSQTNQIYELSRLSTDDKAATYFLHADDSTPQDHKRQLDIELDSIHSKRFKKD